MLQEPTRESIDRQQPPPHTNHDQDLSDQTILRSVTGKLSEFQQELVRKSALFAEVQKRCKVEAENYSTFQLTCALNRVNVSHRKLEQLVDTLSSEYNRIWIDSIGGGASLKELLTQDFVLDSFGTTLLAEESQRCPKIEQLSDKINIRPMTKAEQATFKKAMAGYLVSSTNEVPTIIYNRDIFSGKINKGGVPLLDSVLWHEVSHALWLADNPYTQSTETGSDLTDQGLQVVIYLFEKNYPGIMKKLEETIPNPEENLRSHGREGMIRYLAEQAAYVVKTDYILKMSHFTQANEPCFFELQQLRERYANPYQQVHELLRKKVDNELASHPLASVCLAGLLDGSIELSVISAPIFRM